MTSTVPHQALYRRWRAQTFAEIVGQEAVVETLRNAVRADRVGHAILFVGPRGTGKTSLARILAKALNCTNLQDGDACDACPSCVSIREGTTLDLIEIDAASNRGIDDVRSLRERLPYPPGQLRKKVYILDEAHQITGPAWNALLKSIEEPPPFVVFMFASTEPSGFPPAILSRLQRYDVRRLTIPEIEGKLSRILAADERLADAAAIHLIARLAAGGMRDAESMLDQLLSAAPERIDEAHVRDLLGLADAEVIDAFVDHPRSRRCRRRRGPARPARRARPGRPGTARPGGRSDPDRAGGRSPRSGRRRATIRRRSPPPAAGWPRSTPIGPASAACASSSSSRSSGRADGFAVDGAAPRPQPEPVPRRATPASSRERAAARRGAISGSRRPRPCRSRSTRRSPRTAQRG